MTPPSRGPSNAESRATASVSSAIAISSCMGAHYARIARRAQANPGSLVHVTDGELILVAGALLAAGIAASLLAARVRLPGLLLFLALGMALGSDGAGWIDFGHRPEDY